MIEIDIPTETVDLLLQHVLRYIDESDLGKYPFYTKVTPELLQSAFGNFLKIDLVSTAYIYAHDETIPLHVDRYKHDAIYNLNVPILTFDKEQKFIVFDQEFTECGCEWQDSGISQKRHQPLTNEDKVRSNEDNDHIESISYVGKKPCETDGVYMLTDMPVNEEIVNDLPFSKEFYYGLSGKTWTQLPGKGLLFKSSQLHGTGKQDKFKIGCVLMLRSQDCLLVL
jgi:hypothetical protein